MPLDDTPPELVADLMESGITIAGGGGQLRGLGERLREEVNIRAWLADDAMTCVARGAGRVLEDYNNLRRLLTGPERGSTRHWSEARISPNSSVPRFAPKRNQSYSLICDKISRDRLSRGLARENAWAPWPRSAAASDAWPQWRHYHTKRQRRTGRRWKTSWQFP